MEFDFHDLARARLSCKILQECVYLARSCKREVILQDNQLGKFHKTLFRAPEKLWRFNLITVTKSFEFKLGEKKFG